MRLKTSSVLLIVAHPDDETLWAGGTILSHPEWSVFVISLCRASDTDRAPKFYRALEMLDSKGIMCDLDDGPEQVPVSDSEISKMVLLVLPQKKFDFIISHDPSGEYTRHKRHEEVGRAVINLWHEGKISADCLWTFAYEDGNKAYYPKPIESAGYFNLLPEVIWNTKHKIITETYGFEKNSWEAQTTPRGEAFRQFTNSADAIRWLKINEKI